MQSDCTQPAETCRRGIPSCYLSYSLLIIAHIAIVWWLPYLPTQDGPSHIYNLVILHDLINGGKEWGNYFDYDLRAVPNLGFHLLAYPLLHLFSPFIVEKLVLTGYILLMGTSVPFYLQMFDRNIFPHAFFVFPIIFNYTMLMGFYSYILAVPIFLLCFAVCWRSRNRSLPYRFVCHNGAGFILYFCHLIPCIYFVVALLLISLVEPVGMTRKFRELYRQILLLAPLLLTILLYLRSSSSGSLPDFSELLSPARNAGLLTDLFFFSSINFSPWQIVPAAVVAYLLSMMLLSTFKTYRRYDDAAGAPKPASEITAGLLTLLLLILYLCAPFRFGGGSYFNQRLPWVILLVSLPLLHVPKDDFRRRYFSAIVVGCAWLFLAVNSYALWQQSDQVRQFLKGLQAELPKGAFVMTYHRPGQAGYSRVNALLHAVSYYGIVKGAVDIGNYEAGLPYFPVSFKKGLPAFPASGAIEYQPERIQLENYPAIQYIVSWDTNGSDERTLSALYDSIYQEDKLRLWKRR